MRKARKLLAATSLGLLLFNTVFSSNALSRECWSAVGATAISDEQNRDAIVRGAIPVPVATADPSVGGTKPPLGPPVAVGQTFGFQDHMVSLSRSAPAGTHVLRYSLVPTGYFNVTPHNFMAAAVYVQDNKRDRVVLQLKEIQYRTTSVPLDPKPQIKTVAVIDTAFDPFHFMNDVPSGQFIVLHSEPFVLAATRQIDIADSVPFVARQFVQYYMEVMLITDRQPPKLPVIGPSSGDIGGPALALVAVCPHLDMNTCFFREPNFGGNPLCLRGNESISALDPSFDEQIQSFRVAEGGIVLACEKRNFDNTGWCETYSGSVPRLPSDRNKAISSLMRIR